MTPKEREEFRFTLNEEEQSYLRVTDDQTARVKAKGASRSKKGAAEEQRYCEFCGKPLNGMTTTPDGVVVPLAGIGNRRKYCSEQCQKIASRRRTSARLGIPSRSVSKLNPLYFD